MDKDLRSEDSASRHWTRFTIVSPITQRDELVTVLWELGTMGVEEQDAVGAQFTVYAFFAENRSALDINQALQREAKDRGLSLREVSWDPFVFDPDQWLVSVRQNFHGFVLGRTYYIHPSWEKPKPGFPVNITIEPGHGFGTGTHESTQLCLLALKEYAASFRSMADVGVGSGILSIAAKKLNSALRITALDIDHLATEMAAENFQKNDVRGVRLFTGGPEAVRGTFELVVANLTEPIFKILARDLLRVAGKALILSGFTVDQTPLVLDHFREAGKVKRLRQWSRRGWRCLMLVPAQAGREKGKENSFPSF